MTRSSIIGLLSLIAVPACAQNLILDSVPAIQLSTSSTQSAVQIDPATGNVTVRSQVGNLTSCTGSAPSPPVINTFQPNVSSVTPNSPFSLSWTSTNATSCSPSLGTTTWGGLGTLPTNGTQPLTAPASTGNITFRLTCTNGTSSVSRDTTIEVSSGGGGGNCTPPVPTINEATWSGIFNGQPFPLNNPTTINISSGAIEAISFVASGSIQPFGFFTSQGAALGNVRASISTVRGCFTAASLGSNCLQDFQNQVGLSWQAGGSSAVACVLNVGTTYYLNLQGDAACGNCTREFDSQVQPDGG